MANIFDGFLRQLGTGDTVKDYKHASRLMVTDNYRLSPKYTWLYHVFFDFSSVASYAKTKQLETGMLVKAKLARSQLEFHFLTLYCTP